MTDKATIFVVDDTHGSHALPSETRRAQGAAEALVASEIRYRRLFETAKDGHFDSRC